MSRTLCGALLAALLAAAPAHAGEDTGLADAAQREGALVIAAAVEREAFAPLLEDFGRLHPGIAVTLLDFSSTHLNEHFLSDVATGNGTSDILLSSDMAAQVELAQAGHALTYASPEIPSLPPWAVWRAQLYGITTEPVTFVYDRRQVSERDLRDHAALLALLNRDPQAFRGRIGAYDPEKSGAGYLLATQDAAHVPQAWALFAAFGRAEIRLVTGAADMVDRVASGEHALAFGVFGSYAFKRARADANLGVVMPQDRTLIASRVMFISRYARHPNAAKLFLDYVLSRRGQGVIAGASALIAVRGDVEGEMTAATLDARVGAAARPIPIDESLLAAVAPEAKRAFLDRWRAAMSAR